MTKRSVAWAVMTFLALGIAAYATAMVHAPPARPELVQRLFATRPLTAPAHFLGGAVGLMVGAFQFNACLPTFL